MKNKIEIKDSDYVLEGVERPIVLSDLFGNEFRIKFLSKGGISINKVNNTGESSTIYITPKVTNEIEVN